MASVRLAGPSAFAAENRMSFRTMVVAPIALALTLLCATAVADNAPPPTKFDTVDLSFDKFQLENGLTVVVHEDHKAPVVHVAVWYHIGSAGPPRGQNDL